MIVFSINHTNYKNLITDFARLLNIKPRKSDVLELPLHIGSGYVKAIELQPELHVLIVDATWVQPLVTKRDKSSKTDFILHFDDVYVNTTASLRVDDELLQKSNTRHSVARLTSNLFFNMEEVPANMHIKSIKIMFTEGWLKKYLGLDRSESVIQQYLSLKTESFDIEKLDEGYFKLMNELCHVSDDAPLRQIYVMNRVNLLIERFFRRLYGKMRLLKGEFNNFFNTSNKLCENYDFNSTVLFSPSTTTFVKPCFAKPFIAASHFLPLKADLSLSCPKG